MSWVEWSYTPVYLYTCGNRVWSYEMLRNILQSVWTVVSPVTGHKTEQILFILNICVVCIALLLVTGFNWSFQICPWAFQKTCSFKNINFYEHFFQTLFILRLLYAPSRILSLRRLTSITTVKAVGVKTKMKNIDKGSLVTSLRALQKEKKGKHRSFKSYSKKKQKSSQSCFVARLTLMRTLCQRHWARPSWPCGRAVSPFHRQEIVGN